MAKSPRTPTKVSELTLDPANARLHPERNEQMIDASLDAFGPARGVVIDETGRVLAGNGVTAGARRKGIKKLLVVDADKDTLVAVRVTGLTEKQKLEYAIADNRTNETSEWDPGGLKAALDAGADVSAFFTKPEIDALLDPPPADDDDTGPAEESDGYKEQYGVIVICTNAKEQERVYNELLAKGFNCRVVST